MGLGFESPLRHEVFGLPWARTHETRVEAVSPLRGRDAPSRVPMPVPGAPVPPSAARLAGLLVTAAAELSDTATAPSVVALPGAPVRSGRLNLGRLPSRLPAAGPVMVVAGFVSACWVGALSESHPELGRLVYRTDTRLDARGRIVLAGRARTWLGVADPASFEVVPMSAAGGGVLLVPVEDFRSTVRGGVPVSAGTVQALCQRVRPELVCLGEPGTALLATVGVVEATGGQQAEAVLTDPSFALEVLMASGADGDAALVGRVLEFLRARAGAPASGGAGAMLAPSPTRRRAGRLADAVATYESGALALMARGTQHTYRTWTRRLVAVHGDDEPDAITTGDLKDLIARHVLTGRDERDRRRSGRSAEENAVSAYRHLWAYSEEKA